MELVDHRRRHPSNDLATALAEAEFEEEHRSDIELGSIMRLLAWPG